MAFGAFAFTACGGDDSGGSSDTVWTGKTSTYGKASNADNTKSFKSNDGKTFAQFGPGSVAVIGFNPSDFPTLDKTRVKGIVVKEAEEQAYYVGVYAFKGTINLNGEPWLEFELPGWGIVRVQGEGVDKTMIIAMTDVGELETKVKEEGKLYTDVTSEDICRTWEVQNTEFTYEEFQGEKRTLRVKHNFPGCNLEQMAEWLKKEHGIDIAADLAAKKEIETIDFNPYGTFSIKLLTDNCVGTWKWANEPLGILNFSWFSDNMDNSFENGTAVVRPMGKSNNLLELTLEGKAIDLDTPGKYYKVTLVGLMSEKK